MDKKLRSNFEKLLDRKASDEEIKHLYHVKNTLGIRDNDSLWLILMTLESYNSLYKRYPAMMSAECDKVLRKQKDHLEAIAEAETKKYLSKLTESVTDTAKHIAGRQSDAMLLLSWGWFFAALTVFGALCVMVGYVVGTGKVPPWVFQGDNFGALVAGTLAKTPAGWITALGAGIVSTSALWRIKDDLTSRKNRILLAISMALIVFSVLCIFPALVG
ncbi:MAG: hypothetical protein IKU14_08510 [Rhodocyclaceae bacterium]|nr:hypothetical protein [Rhodocyclaceae bacterium]